MTHCCNVTAPSGSQSLAAGQGTGQPPNFLLELRTSLKVSAGAPEGDLPLSLCHPPTFARPAKPIIPHKQHREVGRWQKTTMSHSPVETDTLEDYNSQLVLRTPAFFPRRLLNFRREEKKPYQLRRQTGSEKGGGGERCIFLPCLSSAVGLAKSRG